MPDRSDISPLSITDGKISNEAKIAHAKLAKAVEGQVLVAQADGKFAAKTLAGDVTLDAAGNTTSNVAVSTDGTTVVTGATGAKGDKGDTGNQGATGPAGSDATVTTSAVDSAGAVMHTDITGTGLVKRTGSEAYSTSSTTDDLGEGSTNKYASSTNVNAAGAVMHTDIPDSDTGFVKRTGAETYDVDTSTYSTTSHTHDHNALTNYDVAEHRVINDDLSSPSTTELWSASNISYLLSGKASSSHSHSYSSLTGIPSTFTPSSHNHSGGDITSGTVDTDRLDVGTTSGKVAAGDHTHSGYSTTGHTHDSRYFQESEFLNASAGAGDAGKPVKLDADGHIDSSMINSGDVSFVDLDDLPSTFAPSSHTHSTGNNGFVPAAGSSGQFLAHDGTFQTPAGNLDWTTDQGSTNIHAGNYTNTTYTADDGIGLTGTAFSVAAGTGLSQDATGLSLNLQGVAEEAVRADEDYIVFLDGGSTGAAKKESIEDLATAMAGSGLTANSGELAIDFKYARSILWSTTQTDISYNTGDTIATITHNLGSLYVTVSVKDVDGVLHNTAASSTGGYLLDLDYDVLIRVVDSNKISIEFDVDTGTMGDIITNQNEFQVTVMG